TYMNKSGECVLAFANFFKIKPENIIILFDDISLDVGKLRIRRKGSHGGHNGLKDICLSFNSEDFPRVKIGVGEKPHPAYNLADWVLSKFTEKELESLDFSLENSIKAVELIVCGKIETAMNKFNS
ncbi:MAG: aminoacyl-tRNA hydrolase, partial [Oscillospiraceae bacterium]